jgi:hypothetical protein
MYASTYQGKTDALRTVANEALATLAASSVIRKTPR